MEPSVGEESAAQNQLLSELIDESLQASFGKQFTIQKEQLRFEQIDRFGNAFLVNMMNEKDWIPIVFKKGNILNENTPRSMRMVTICRILSKANLGPQLLIANQSHSIETYAGKSISEFVDCGNIFRWMGLIIGRLHKDIPIDWFEPFRVNFYESIPCLQGEPLESALWPSLCKNKYPLRIRNEALKLLSCLPKPFSHYGSRAVTIHGDVHTENVCSQPPDFEGSLKLIDFEFSCVSSAVQDFVHVIGAKDADRHLFLTTYVETVAGSTPTEEEINALCFDAQVASHVHFYIVRPVLFNQKKRGLLLYQRKCGLNPLDIDDAFRHVNQLNRILTAANESPKLKNVMIHQKFDLRENRSENGWPWWSEDQLQNHLQSISNS